MLCLEGGNKSTAKDDNEKQFSWLHGVIQSFVNVQNEIRSKNG